VKKLNLEGTGLGHSLSEIVPFFPSNLSSFGLILNGITPDLCKVFPLLLKSTNITSIDISHNWIGMEGVVNLSLLFLKNKITILHLENNKIFKDDDDPQLLMNLLKNLKYLQQFYIGKNSMEDEDFIELCEAFKTLNNLRVLDFTGNPISKTGIIEFVKIFPELINLQEINLSLTQLGDDGCQILFQNLHLLPRIKKIFLEGTRLTHLCFGFITEYLYEKFADNLGKELKISLKGNQFGSKIKDFEEAISKIKEEKKLHRIKIIMPPCRS
jgi:Ran GTPase-activating protein (RanGAP) involved in mRNA processing and transport